MKAIADVVNEVQVRQNGEDIRIKMLNKAKNGGTNSRVPLGYLNVRKRVDGHEIRTVVLDPERQHFMRLAFELFATGDYTLDSLQKRLTEAGLRMPNTGTPVAVQTLQKLLRSRYYLGVVPYKGDEFPGRHEALITSELFERVQRVIYRHQGAGTRQRTHYHYLKGLLWCGRCGGRFVVQRAVGRRGGVYFYFFCKRRRDGICDQPYVPVEVMEQAVVDHYGVAVSLPAEFRQLVRTNVDAAISGNFELSAELREQYTRRLAALGSKEDYFLDLAGDEGWPKDKLRIKIGAVRKERQDIQQSLERAEHQLEIGRQIFHSALDLLDHPQIMYRQGNEAVRKVLNRAIGTAPGLVDSGAGWFRPRLRPG
jgi:site-specific DNA recombinase